MDVRLEKLRANAKLLAQMLDEVNEAGDSNPAVKTVHRLRTSTRRCGALLVSLTSEGRPSQALRALRKDAARLERQWKKLRRVAGGVRDLDVHCEMVEELRAETAGVGAVEAKSQSAVVKSQSAIVSSQSTGGKSQSMGGPLWVELEAWLRQERHERAKALKAEVAERGSKVKELADAVLQVLTARFGQAGAAGSKRSAKSPALLALEDFAVVAAEMPVLDSENLHDFRKRTKEARYLAEAGGETAEAVSVARALKRIQDVIGGWHDRDALSGEAEQALGKPGRAFTEHLRRLAATEMQEAIRVTERMRGRLLGERQALGRSQRRPGSVKRAAGQKAEGEPAAAVAEKVPERFPAQRSLAGSERTQSSA
jgi:CHAD domain-containing protein